VSQLVDICRQAIVFDTVCDLAACLRAIRDDPAARLLRVKNRLDPAYDAATSAGYRDVALNLCLATEWALEMGLETHVCEVQLLLRPFAELKVRICGVLEPSLGFLEDYGWTLCGRLSADWLI
jgi:hypothetical protein